jgi:exopolysaccharide biosynthesis operon protein EpsL
MLLSAGRLRSQMQIKLRTPRLVLGGLRVVRVAGGLSAGLLLGGIFFAGPASAQTHLPGPLPTVYAPVLLPQAEGGSRYRVAAGSTVAYDSNVFRLSANAPTDSVGAPGRSRSSLITRLYAQGNADIPVGRQRFHAQATGNAYTFPKLGYLNYRALDGRAGWLWRLTDRFSGELRYDRTAGIADFIDTRPVVKNIRTVDAWLGSVDFAVTPRWVLGGGLAQTNGKNSDAGFKVSDSRQLTRELGLKYLGMDQNTIRGFMAFSDGETPNLVPTAAFDKEYKQRDAGLEVLYGLSEASYLRARVAYTDRSYPIVSSNDFRGPTGRLDFNWRLSPISGVQFSVRRELGAFIETNSTYFVNTAMAVSPWWEVLPKVRLELGFERWNRNYRGTITSGPRRSDTLDFARIGVRWSPTQNWQITSGLNWSRRDSNIDSFDFVDRVLFAQIEYAF